MLTLFIYFDIFSYAQDIKGKHEITNQRADHYEEKLRMHPQQSYGFLNTSSKLVAVSRNDFKHMPKWLFL